MLNKNKGITLIMLVVTIVVLLILAGTTIELVFNENGIISKAQDAKEEIEKATITEQRQLAMVEAAMNNKNQTYTDEDGNTAIIPEGFAVTHIKGEMRINEGLVITDSKGNEFVWVPIGNIKKQDGTIINIKLDRYSFDYSTGMPKEFSGSSIEEDARDVDNLLQCGNTIAIDIEEFKKSANDNNGFYIARYEASYGKDGKVNSKVSTVFSTTKVEKEEGMLWNFVTQQEAAKASRAMYTSNSFRSDLMNSYAWDSAIVFLQNCDNRKTKETPYSLETSINNTLLNTRRDRR